MKNLQQQRGIGLINLVLVILVVAFCGIFALKVLPMYAENRYIISGLKELVDPGSKLEQMTDAEIKKKMNNFYTVNNVRGKEAQNIVIERSVSQTIVKIDYEARAELFANISVLVNFQNHLDSNNPTMCCTPLAEPKSVKY